MMEIDNPKMQNQPSVNYNGMVPLYYGSKVLVSNNRLIKASAASSVKSNVIKLFTALVTVEDIYRSLFL